MKPLKTPFNTLVMVCDNTRPPGAQKHSCGDHGAAELRAWLKARLKEDGLWGREVRVLRTSCLDICPRAGVVVAFEGGADLRLMDAQTDREALLEEIRRRAQDEAGSQPS